jgi:hypothetical protein
MFDVVLMDLQCVTLRAVVSAHRVPDASMFVLLPPRRPRRRPLAA